MAQPCTPRLGNLPPIRGVSHPLLLGYHQTPGECTPPCRNPALFLHEFGARTPRTRALHTNVPSNLVPSTFLKHFRWERGCPWYGPSAPPGRHFAIRTLGYKRAFGAGTRYASLGFILGILGATGRDQGGTWYGTSAKPERHFTKGMFGKP